MSLWLPVFVRHWWSLTKQPLTKVCSAKHTKSKGEVDEHLSRVLRTDTLKRIQKVIDLLERYETAFNEATGCYKQLHA